MADAIGRLLDAAAKDKAELLAILASLTEGIIATDDQQQVLIANDAAGAMLDFSADDARGKPLWRVLRLDWLIKAAGQVLQDGQKRHFDPALMNGRQVEIWVVAYPAGGPLQGLVLVAHDATEAVRYQELRKEFVANVSHELRHAAQRDQGICRDAAARRVARSGQGGAVSRDHRAPCQPACQSHRRPAGLVQARKPAAASRRTVVDLSEIAKRGIEMLTAAAQAKRHNVIAEIPRVPAVAGNPAYLERAVCNLLDNAIKYTGDGGEIRVCTGSDGKSAYVEVADNGIGIPAADMPRIFERFYRVDRSRSREMGGTGLGLAITKHIMQVHGGCAEAESTVGKGSVFRLRLPLIAAAGLAAVPP